MPYTTTTGIPYADADTSQLAAELLDPEKVKADERRIYQLLLARGERGATDDELEVELNLKHQTASARRRGIRVKYGFCTKTDRTRLTRTGRPARVYVALTDPEERADELKKVHEERRQEWLSRAKGLVDKRLVEIIQGWDNLTLEQQDVMHGGLLHYIKEG